MFEYEAPSEERGASNAGAAASRPASLNEPVPPFDPEELSAEELDAWERCTEVEGASDATLDADPGSERPPDPVLSAAAARVLDELDAIEDRVDILNADQTLAAAASSRWAVYRAQARQLALAGHWASLNAVVTTAAASGAAGGVSARGGERLFPLGGDGTPEVAEFAPAELAVVLGLREDAAASLMGDALDLRHRFPLLCQAVLAGTLEVWLARKIVQRARALSREAASRVDRAVAHLAGALTWPRLRRIVDAAILAADPTQARSEAELAAADCGAWMQEETRCGYGTMILKAARGDLDAMDQALSVIAEALRTLGDADPHDRRRARGVGILAHPETAQFLIDLAESVRRLQVDAAAARASDEHDRAASLESRIAELVASWTGAPAKAVDDPAKPGRVRRRPHAFTTAVLYYHVSRESFEALLCRRAAGVGAARPAEARESGGWTSAKARESGGWTSAEAGVVRAEDIGPVLLEQLTEWLEHANVVVKPVIDLAGVPQVDRYEAPASVAEAIGLRFPADYSPYSTSLSRRQDLDHTVSYRPMEAGGPPGQTDAAKMGRLARGRHRLKTHGGWTVRQVGPLAWLWRTPHGYSFFVNAHGTIALGRL